MVGSYSGTEIFLFFLPYLLPLIERPRSSRLFFTYPSVACSRRIPSCLHPLFEGVPMRRF